ncbi:MAG TPA: sigma-70 family RNA polymerase sigma factor [Candidatus Cybelea sp.]|nr:sigma-70 family RNA polymerase sigma factor [Candidatus Cybelea sp.]
MDEVTGPAPDARANLDTIATHWFTLGDANQFLVRYEQAVRSYLAVLLGNADEADDVAHDFFIRVVERGFEHADPKRGRFRDYLKVAVRNAALSHLRRKQREPHLTHVAHGRVPVPQEAADNEWLREWQSCVLQRAWRALKRHEDATPDNYFHTVLCLHVDRPDDNSRALAERVAAAIGRPFSADAYRKQLSRARRKFAQLIVHEVAQTLERPSRERILEELADIGLRDFVIPFLAKA